MLACWTLKLLAFFVYHDERVRPTWIYDVGLKYSPPTEHQKINCVPRFNLLNKIFKWPKLAALLFFEF